MLLSCTITGGAYNNETRSRVKLIAVRGDIKKRRPSIPIDVLRIGRAHSTNGPRVVRPRSLARKAEEFKATELAPDVILKFSSVWTVG